jgi:hypothetical protein
MPRFYFDTFDGQSWTDDDLGLEVEDLSAAITLAQQGLADIVHDELPDGHALRLMVVVKDENRKIVGEAIIDMIAGSRG